MSIHSSRSPNVTLAGLAPEEGRAAPVWKRTLYAISAIGFAINALHMLADPAGWYATVPGVPNTGPFNPHFVRDIGVAYLTLTGLLALAAWRPRWAFPLLLAVTLYLGLHAGLHLWDIAAARLPLDHLLVDAPGVFLPVLFFAWLAATAYPHQTH